MKKLTALLLILVMVFAFSSVAMAAPYYVSGDDTGNAWDLLTITNPEYTSVTVFDPVYVISGYAAQWSTVNIYRMNDMGSYELMPCEMYVGGSGIFFQQVNLRGGKNMLVVRVDMPDGRYQQVRCDVTLLGQSFLDYIKNL